MNLGNLRRLWAHRRLHARGLCTVCGARTLFYTKDAREVGHARESMFCLRCKSVSRKRHIAKVLLETFAPQSRSLAAARGALSRLSIYSAVSNDQIYRAVGEGNANYVCSEFFPDVAEGESRDGVRCENLERLTFADEQFDLVITEDVLEHVRRPDDAFREIRRVLKPGGYHVFTIPFELARETVSRVDTTTEEDVQLLPPAYHGDTLRDRILVYTDYGYDLLPRLSSHGFDTRLRLSTHADARLNGIADSYVFVSRKI
jgi:SAM-dependent methyltransferase